VHLRAQGQKDPLIEYKNEAYELFQTLMANIEQEALQNLFRSAANLEQILEQLHGHGRPQDPGSPDPEQQITRSNIAQTGSSGHVIVEDPNAGEIKLNLPKRRPPSFDIDQMGRNAPCPCGSGKKYKQCCGKEA
jgi:preprotein translocase subunit SecA